MYVTLSPHSPQRFPAHGKLLFLPVHAIPKHILKSFETQTAGAACWSRYWVLNRAPVKARRGWDSKGRKLEPCEVTPAPGHTSGCSEQLWAAHCASQGYTFRAARPQDAPKPPVQVNTSYMGTPVTKPAFCTPLPWNTQHELRKPWDAPSSSHGSRLTGSKHTSLCCPNTAALSVHHLCFSSRQTKQHRSPGFEKDDTQMKWTAAARCSQRGKAALRSEGSSASVVPGIKVKFLTAGERMINKTLLLYVQMWLVFLPVSIAFISKLLHVLAPMDLLPVKAPVLEKKGRKERTEVKLFIQVTHTNASTTCTALGQEVQSRPCSYTNHEAQLKDSKY